MLQIIVSHPQSVLWANTLLSVAVKKEVNSLRKFTTVLIQPLFRLFKVSVQQEFHTCSGTSAGPALGFVLRCIPLLGFPDIFITCQEQ